LPRILIVKTRVVPTQIFLKCVQQTRKTAAKEKKETHKTGGGCKKNKGNSSSELILSIVNKKTIQGLINKFDCDATLEVNKIKVKCAFVKQLRNILQLTYQQEILFPLQLKSKNVKHLLL
jgi:hypothetical protein